MGVLRCLAWPQGIYRASCCSRIAAMRTALIAIFRAQLGAFERVLERSEMSDEDASYLLHMLDEAVRFASVGDGETKENSNE